MAARAQNSLMPTDEQRLRLLRRLSALHSAARATGSRGPLAPLSARPSAERQLPAAESTGAGRRLDDDRRSGAKASESATN